MEKNEKQAKKKAKTKKILKKQLGKIGLQKGGDLRPYLQGMSLYLQTLLDPLNYPGVKIPDLITAPSFCVQCKQVIPVTVNPQGVAGVIVQVGSVNSTSYYTTAVGATPTSMTYTSAPKSYGTQLNQVADLRRPVSAILFATSLASPNNATGRLITYFLPGLREQIAAVTGAVVSGSSGQQLAPGSTSTMLTYPYSADIPASRAYSQVRYLPLDPISTIYMDSLTTASRGILAIVGDGLAVGTTVEFTYIENFECTALSNQINLVQPTPSFHDPLEMAVAANAISADPHIAVEVPVENIAADQPVRHREPLALKASPPQAPLYERVLSMISKGLPVLSAAVTTGAHVAKTIAPLLV